MNENLMELVFFGLTVLVTWLITRHYYRKSLNNQEAEATRELAKLVKALHASNTEDQTLLKQKYIDEAVAAWKRQGTAINYLDSLPNLSKEEKAQILRSAALRYKGREPKRNPYAS